MYFVLPLHFSKCLANKYAYVANEIRSKLELELFTMNLSAIAFEPNEGLDTIIAKSNDINHRLEELNKFAN